MRLIATLLPLLCSTLVASESLSLFGDQAPIGGNDLKVPGKNPLSFCADPSDYILSIDYVDLDPNPPTAGSTLSIIANGTLSEDIDEGAKVLVQVKYGLIRLINQEADLCEQIGNVDLECPLKEGEMALTKDVKIPKEVPKGKYTVMADAYTKDKKKITCLEAVVYFQAEEPVGTETVVLGGVAAMGWWKPDAWAALLSLLVVGLLGGILRLAEVNDADAGARHAPYYNTLMG